MGSKCITPIAEGGFLNFKCNQFRSHVKNVGHSKVLGRDLGEGVLTTATLITLEPCVKGLEQGNAMITITYYLD